MAVDDAPDELDALQQRHRFLEARTAEIAGQLKALGSNIPAVLTTLAELEAEKSAVIAAIKEKKGHEHRPSVDDTKQLVQLLAETQGDELKALRERIHQQLRLLIKHIDVAIEGRRVRCEVHLESGRSRVVWFDYIKGKGMKGLTVHGIMADPPWSDAN